VAGKIVCAKSCKRNINKIKISRHSFRYRFALCRILKLESEIIYQMIKLKSLTISLKVFAIAVLFLLFTPSILQAQGSDEPPPPFDEGVTDVPIPFDDWVFVLVAIVVAYVLVRAKMYKADKNNKESILQH
jgi:hypothetical protein